MKTLSLSLFLILNLFVYKPICTFSQTKLPSGLYKLSDNGNYTLTLNGTTYHTDITPLALLKNMDNFSVTKERSPNDYYVLNIELDAEATQTVKNIPFDYSQKTHIGLIVAGKLVIAPLMTGTVTNGKISIGSKSKSELDQIYSKLKAEKGKN